MAMFGRENGGSRVGSAPISSQQEQIDRRERLRLLALEKISLDKDPYFMRVCDTSLFLFKRFSLMFRITWALSNANCVSHYIKMKEVILLTRKESVTSLIWQEEVAYCVPAFLT